MSLGGFEVRAKTRITGSYGCFAEGAKVEKVPEDVLTQWWQAGLVTVGGWTYAETVKAQQQPVAEKPATPVKKPKPKPPEDVPAPKLPAPPVIVSSAMPTTDESGTIELPPAGELPPYVNEDESGNEVVNEADPNLPPADETSDLPGLGGAPKPIGPPPLPPNRKKA